MPKRRRGKGWRCEICGQVFAQMTPGHLRTHGYSTQRYKRLYGGRASPLPPVSTSISSRVGDELASRGNSLVPMGAPGSEEREDLVASIAHRLADSKVWMACVADEVGEKLMNGPLRQRLTAALVTTLATRLHVQGEAGALLTDVLCELKEEWRITQGGDGAGPTPTADLVGLANALSRQLRDAEDLTLRAIKLALDEQKLEAEHAGALGPALYSGDAETIDVGTTKLSTGERETIRNLLTNMAKHVKGTVVGDSEEGEAAGSSNELRSPMTTEQDDGTEPPAPPAPVDPLAIPETPSRRRRRRRRRPPEPAEGVA